MLETVLLCVSGLVILTYIYGSSYITYCTLKSAMFDPWQKAIITAAIWLIPFIAAAFLYRLLAEEISDTNIAKPPLITFIYLASDMSWSYGHGNHYDSSTLGSDSSNGDSN